MSSGAVCSSDRALPARERLLRVAKHLFANQGFERTSTIVIARTAGSSETQLLKKFGSKEGLLEAVFDDDWAIIGEKLRVIDSSGLSAADTLTVLISTLVEHLDNDQDAKKLLVIELGRVRRKPGFEILLTRGYRESCVMVERLFHEMQRTGRLRRDSNAATLRSCLFGMMCQLWLDQLLAPDNSAYDSKQIIVMTKLFVACLPSEPSYKAVTG